MRQILEVKSGPNYITICWIDGGFGKSEMHFVAKVNHEIIRAFDDAIINAKQYAYSIDETKRDLEKAGFQPEITNER